MKIPSNAYKDGDIELRKPGATIICTPEEAQWIALEKAKCFADINYFAETYFTIVSMDSRGQHVIKMYPKQRELLKFYKENNRCIVLASRQVGKTTTYAIYILWLMIFFPSYYVKILANKGETVQEIAEKVALGYRMLPFWLKPGVKTFNTKKIIFENGSKMTVHATSPANARGGSARLLIFDELAFLNPPSIADKVWASAYPVVSSSPETKVIIVSTPQGTGNLYYTLYSMAKSNKSDPLGIRWKLFEFKWNEVPGRDERWKKQQIEAVGIDTWNQEFDLKFTVGSSTLIEPDFILKHRESQMTMMGKWEESHPESEGVYWENIPLKMIPGATWRRYKKADLKRSYVIGVDSSDGVGNNWSVAKVFDVTDCFDIEEVACFRDNKTSPVDFAYVVAQLGYEYNNAVIACENNNMGSTVLTFLAQVFNYDNIFSTPGKKIGINTTFKQKQQACIWFRLWTNLCVEGIINMKLHSSNLLDELERFVKKGEGDNARYEGDKINDDEVMACIMAFNMLMSENCQAFWNVTFDKVRAFEIPRWLRVVKPLDKYILESSKDKLDATFSSIGRSMNSDEYEGIGTRSYLRDMATDRNTSTIDDELIPTNISHDSLIEVNTNSRRIL